MVGRIAAVVFAVNFFAMLAFAMNRLALAVWPAYAEAAPAYSFSGGMLAARLAVAAAALACAGGFAALVARGERVAVVMTAAALLLLGGIIHLTEPTWSHFPLWYHLVFIGSIAPSVLIGGRLRGAQTA